MLWYCRMYGHIWTTTYIWGWTGRRAIVRCARCGTLR